jgi:cold shock CspA family protein
MLSPTKAYGLARTLTPGVVLTLSEGDCVSFDVVEGPKGLQGVNVVKIS